MDRNTLVVLNKVLDQDKKEFITHILEPTVRALQALDERVKYLETPRIVRLYRAARGKVWSWWFLRKKRALAKAKQAVVS